MKNTTKTIIIGVTITILVLFLVIFIFYKIDSKKINKDTTTNKNDYNNATPVTNTNNNSNISNNNSSSNNTNTSISDDEKNSKIIIYLFHGSTCPACNNAIKSIKDNRNTTFKNVIIKTFEIYNNKDNNALYNKLADKFQLERKKIPYFIIGEYNKVGFNAETLLKEYKKALKNKNYKDIVEEVIKENPNLNPIYEII